MNFQTIEQLVQDYTNATGKQPTQVWLDPGFVQHRYPQAGMKRFKYGSIDIIPVQDGEIVNQLRRQRSIGWCVGK